MAATRVVVHPVNSCTFSPRNYDDHHLEEAVTLMLDANNQNNVQEWKLFMLYPDPTWIHFIISVCHLPAFFAFNGLHLWLFFGLLSSGSLSHLGRKQEVSGLYSPWLWLRTNSGVKFTLQDSLTASDWRYLQKLWLGLVSSPFLCFLHLISGFSAEHFLGTTILSSESASGKLNLKYFTISSYCTLYFHFILLNSQAFACSKSIFLLVPKLHKCRDWIVPTAAFLCLA